MSLTQASFSDQPRINTFKTEELGCDGRVIYHFIQKYINKKGKLGAGIFLRKTCDSLNLHSESAGKHDFDVTEHGLIKDIIIHNGILLICETG